MSIEDTSKRNPVTHLAGAAVEGSSGYIEGMESAGQREVVSSSLIPTEMVGCGAADLEALGFTLGPVCEDDPLFREATLPEGWSREGSDHAMHSYIVDERGFRRIGIFYKAAFYDRRADLHIEGTPATRAQEESYSALAEVCPYPQWAAARRSRDGDNLVWRAEEQALDGDGRAIFDHAAGSFKRTGRVHERVVAPDGSSVKDSESPRVTGESRA